MLNTDEILSRLFQSVIEGDADAAVSSAKMAIESGVDPLIAIEEGLSRGVKEVGERFGRGEVFLPELIMAAEAMKEGMKVIMPYVPKGKERKSLGRVIIGTVKGDLHDIGKSIVAAMFEAADFEVFNLGVDVLAETFVEKVKELRPDIVGLSALLTTTLPEMERVINALKKAHLRDKVKVMVGGAPVTQEFAHKIGADARGADAVEAVEKAKKLLGIK